MPPIPGAIFEEEHMSIKQLSYKKSHYQLSISNIHTINSLIPVYIERLKGKILCTLHAKVGNRVKGVEAYAR
ncbi:hypothetical protein AB990_13440 [Alkalihalobacillus pseudalcaliphilus]|nr:hypothetical protein AB990_13440 [Alkalihalobacillus pseudalcaliphilus]